MNPQVNQVWMSKEGHTCIIIEAFLNEKRNPEQTIPQLMMLWFDSVDECFVVSEILERLNYQLTLSFEQALSRMMKGK